MDSILDRPRISDEIVRSYESDGAVCLRGIFSSAEVNELLRSVDAAVEQNGSVVKDFSKDGTKGFITAKLSRRDKNIRAFALGSVLPLIAARLMRAERVRFYQDHLFVKKPGAPEKTMWHQDLPFWPFQGNDIVSLWVALTPVSRESSGVEYIAGSHRWGKLYEAEFSDQRAYVNSGREKCPDFDQSRNDPSLRFLSWTLEPGDIVAHHPLTIHGAGGNSSETQRRVGLSVRYLGKDVRWDPRPETGPAHDGVNLRAGEYPADDTLFPQVYPKDARSNL